MEDEEKYLAGNNSDSGEEQVDIDGISDDNAGGQLTWI